jgi:hypothetical protein
MAARQSALVSSLLLLACGCGLGPAQTDSSGNAMVVEDEPITMMAGTACGKERWSVKTGTDADASSVSLSPQGNSIAALVALAVPPAIPLNGRVAPAETTAWQFNDVTLLRFKAESDSDYHLVLSDGANTMIAEIPDPGCVGSQSPFASLIQQARTNFSQQYTPSGSFQTVNATVSIAGVGMFDFLHGQSGVAPNGIELHPVLDICFGAGCSLATGP